MRNHCTLDRPCEKAVMFRDVAVGLRKAALLRGESERRRQNIENGKLWNHRAS